MISDPDHQNAARLLFDHPVMSTILLLLLLSYVFARYLTPRVDPLEPPVVSHPIPFFGHLIGILLSGMKYFVDVGEKKGLPVYTLPVLDSKVYVITAPDYVTACLRETKTLSFNPFIVEVFKRMTGLSDVDMIATRQDMDSRTVSNYLNDMHKVEYASLAPGPDLDQMNLVVWSEMARLLEEIPQHQTLGLFEITSNTISRSSVTATYGTRNPFDTDPTLVDDFWKFEKDLKWLLLNVWPPVTVKEAHQARQRLIDAFMSYYRDEGFLRASGLVQQRLRIAVQYDQPPLVIAAFEVGILFGLLANTVPTAFWMLVHIYTSPSLLATVRKETELLVSIDASGVRIDLRSESHLRHACPILTSTFYEVLRHISSTLSSGRFVLSDTMIAPSPSPSNPDPVPFLLRAGSSIQLPASPIHYSTVPNSLYHPDPEAFLPSRFADLSLPEPERTVNGNFRAFGGGTTLCPGRRFAYMKVVGFVLMFVNLFDMQGLTHVPTQERTKIAMAVAKPVEDVSIRLCRQPGTEGKKIHIAIG